MISDISSWRPHLREGRRSLTRKLLLAIGVAALVVLVTKIDTLNLGVVRRLELASLDFHFQSRGSRGIDPDSSHVIIVEISRESFESLPETWPWPRSYYARLIRNLAHAGARVVAIDILFVGPDRISPENDAELRKAIQETGIVVLAGKANISGELYRIRSSDENYGNEFYGVDSCLGFVNILKDEDDIVRRYLPFVDVDETLRLPTFGYAILGRLYGLPPGQTASMTSSTFTIGNITAPRVDASSTLIDYYGPSRTFPHIKFSDVLDDESFVTVEEGLTGESINTFSNPEFGYLHEGTFRNKVVIVGSTMPEDQDIHSIPIGRGLQEGDNKMYGVEIHANVVENMLRRDFLYPQSVAAEIFWIVLLCVVSFLVTSTIKEGSRRSAIVELNNFLAVALLLVVVWFLGLWAFSDARYVIPMIGPMFAIVGGYFSSTVYHLASERRERQMIKSMFSTYVNPSVVDELIANPEKLALGGDRKEMTVLFSDLQGFTSFSERWRPEELVGLLNEYLSAMTEIVLRNRGTIDKFEGDQIMAFWGAPVPDKDHAVRACTAALEMQAALADIRSTWERQNKPALFARIGINTGEMIVGNMGSSAKFNYTVIGDSVNLGSRLESANKIYNTGILISEQTLRQAGDGFRYREVDLLVVKGRTAPVRIYELRGLRSDEPALAEMQFLESFAEALELYRNRKWREARELFQTIQQLHPGDAVTAIYLARSQQCEASPPGPDWDGVFRQPEE